MEAGPGKNVLQRGSNTHKTHFLVGKAKHIVSSDRCEEHLWPALEVLGRSSQGKKERMEPGMLACE